MEIVKWAVNLILRVKEEAVKKKGTGEKNGEG
jgi:hypothetical protein